MGVVRPDRMRAALKAFPRHRGAAWLLTAVDLVWAGILLARTPLGRFDAYKPLLWVLTPLAVVLVGVFVDELLAPRALGGLLLLAAAPILDAARWHPSGLRLVVTVLAYGMVLKGLVLVVAPYRFRTATERLFATDAACRLGCGAGVAVGIGLIILAFTVYS